MNNLKKCALAFGGAFIATTCIVQPAAFAATFSELGEPTFIYMNTKQVNLNGEGERVSFIQKRDGILHMCSRDGQHDYLSFLPYDGSRSGLAYRVRKIEMKNPDKVFFEITASRGAHDYNDGYWIVGKYKGQWVTFISLDTLINNGYNTGDLHHINLSNTDDPSAVLITSQHSYMPAGAQYGYQMRSAIDMRLVLHWDSHANWFSTSRIL